MSEHFVAYCRVYPAFSFVIAELRSHRRKFAESEHEKNFVTGSVRFETGVLDTLRQGLSEEEAAIVHKAIKARTSRPQYGVDIIEAGMPILGKVPDGQYQCSRCKQGFESAEGLSDHLLAQHGSGVRKKVA
jgi:hypothetical protein